MPARQAYSHSASVGSRYGFPSFFASQAQNFTASFQLTNTTASSSSFEKPSLPRSLLVRRIKLFVLGVGHLGSPNEERLGDRDPVDRPLVEIAAHRLPMMKLPGSIRTIFIPSEFSLLVSAA